MVVADMARIDPALSGLVSQAGGLLVRYSALSSSCAPGVPNSSLPNNLGAGAADSDFLVFMKAGVTPIRPEWLDVMTACLERPEIGVAGARLLYPSRAIRHAGMVLGLDGGAGCPGRGSFSSDLMYYLNLPRDVSAVSGACLGIRRELFAELGGFDQSFPAYYSDVDLCLRVRERGLRIVVDPRIELTYEDRGPGAGFADRRRLRERWGAVLAQGDPYYPEAFDRTVEDVRLNESG